MMNLVLLMWQDCVWFDWQVLLCVCVLIMICDGGVSEGLYGCWQDGVVLLGGMNFGLYIGDDFGYVVVNCVCVLVFVGQLGVVWFEQVYGVQIVQVDVVIVVVFDVMVLV